MKGGNYTIDIQKEHSVYSVKYSHNPDSTQAKYTPVNNYNYFLDFCPPNFQKRQGEKRSIPHLLGLCNSGNVHLAKVEVNVLIFLLK
jgi:hypothetical protein